MNTKYDDNGSKLHRSYLRPKIRHAGSIDTEGNDLADDQDSTTPICDDVKNGCKSFHVLPSAQNLNF